MEWNEIIHHRVLGQAVRNPFFPGGGGGGLFLLMSESNRTGRGHFGEGGGG